MIQILIPVKDFYKNIPGQGKVKELTKGKSYECKSYDNIKFCILTDLNEIKMYCKKNMFITKLRSRDNKLKELGI